MPHATEAYLESAIIPLSTEVCVDSVSANLHDFGEAQSSQPRNVKAQLHYLSPGLEFTKNRPPVQVVSREATARDPRTTVRLAQGPPETIHDVRGREHEFSLDRNGFMYVRHKCNFEDWESREGIWTGYIEELKELVAKELGGAEGGVDEIIAFHEGVRALQRRFVG